MKMPSGHIAKGHLIAGVLPSDSNQLSDSDKEKPKA